MRIVWRIFFGKPALSCDRASRLWGVMSIPCWAGTVRHLLAVLVFAAGTVGEAWGDGLIAEHPKDQRSVRVVLDPGWNLLAVPGALVPELERAALREDLRLWPVDAGFGQGYWAYSESRRLLILDGAWAVRHRSRGAASGWQLISADALGVDSDPEVERLLRWDRVAQDYVQVHLPLAPLPGEGYFARFWEAEVSEGPPGPPRASLEASNPLGRPVPRPMRPRAPTQLSATAQARFVRLWWQAPRWFEDGSAIPSGMRVSYRLFRDGWPIATLNQAAYDDKAPRLGKAYRYDVTAMVQNPHGDDTLESVPSTAVELSVPASRLAPVPDAFEFPSEASDGRISALSPRTALSKDGTDVVAHLVYAERDPSGGSVLQYRQSRQAGKQGSFSKTASVASLPPGSAFTSWNLTARKRRVLVAWIQRQSDGQKNEDTLYARQSVDGGKTFGAATKVRQGTAAKGSLSLAYDRYDDLHAVWREASKVYYLKNLEGTPANVFDQRKRSPKGETVKYLAQYEPDLQGRCPCDGCWCPESYVLSDEPNRDGGGTPAGPYGVRTEEAVVLEPSLHVDQEKLTIVGRQVRLWDGKPVPHDAWEIMADDPLYSDLIVPGDPPIRRVVGWRAVWKHAYEAGDEALWPGLGIQFQYRYRGTWHQQAQITIAQRPLVAGAWSSPGSHGTEIADEPPGAGFRVGAWKDDVEQPFRISVVHKDEEGQTEGVLGHPRVHTAPGGEMVVVFEKGLFEGSVSTGNNPIHVSFSRDGGLSWSPSVVVAEGRKPQVAVAAPHETVVAYFAADQDGGRIEAVQRIGTTVFSSMAGINPVPLEAHEGTEAAAQEPSLSTLDELVFVAWVKKGVGVPAGDRIAVSRSARVVDVAKINVELPERVTENQSVRVTVSAENKFHMRVDYGGAVRVVKRSSSRPLSGSTKGPSVPNLWFEAPDGAPSSLELTLQGGAASFVTSFASTPTEEGLMNDLVLGAFRVDLAATGDFASDHRYFESRAEFFPADIRGNYDRAVNQRDALLKSMVGSTPQDLYYQVEYGVDPSTSLGAEDAKHLAGFERVWAYTQGITLAQLARQDQAPYRKKAEGLARYLCQHAVRDETTNQILGWPFSWNTLGDNWKDARLVTGANAWAIQGLGVFLASKAYRLMPAGAAKDALKRCYRDALDGLRAHQQVLEVEGRQVVLMTAGWTTEGLVFADAPHKLRTAKGEPLARDPNEVWAYYSILDAIGYDAFAETHVRSCVGDRVRRGDSCRTSEPGLWEERPIVQEAEWAALRRRVAAKNVVTEHNLDVLSVLNHALMHGAALGLASEELLSLGAWRDQLRDGIFYALYDGTGWRAELREAHAELDGLLAFEGRPRTEAQTAFLRERKHVIQKALDGGRLGRVVTGGVLVADQEKGYRLAPSPHAAIDNCSWLSLSVDHQALTSLRSEGTAPYIDRLAACLVYTTIQFVKDLPFEVSRCEAPSAHCPPAKTYRGTHYFQNAFRDPYIEPSELQESSYHLEATMGLILGLLRFAQAHPAHPSAARFLEDARSLWSGAQAFVQDHNFPYSSQRIHNLSTRLSSSTAVVWFIDVHDAWYPSPSEIGLAWSTSPAGNSVWGLPDLITADSDATPGADVAGLAGVDKKDAHGLHEGLMVAGLIDPTGALEASWDQPVTDGLLLKMACYEPRQDHADENRILFEVPLPDFDGFQWLPSVPILSQNPTNLVSSGPVRAVVPPPFSYPCQLGTETEEGWVALSNRFWWHDKDFDRVRAKGVHEAQWVDGALRLAVEFGERPPGDLYAYFWRQDGRSFRDERDVPEELLGEELRPWPDVLGYEVFSEGQTRFVLDDLGGGPLKEGIYEVVLYRKSPRGDLHLYSKQAVWLKTPCGGELQRPCLTREAPMEAEGSGLARQGSFLHPQDGDDLLVVDEQGRTLGHTFERVLAPSLDTCPALQALSDLNPLRLSWVPDGTIWTDGQPLLCQIQKKGKEGWMVNGHPEEIGYALYAVSRTDSPLPAKFALVPYGSNSSHDEGMFGDGKAVLLGRLHQDQNGSPFPTPEDIRGLVDSFETSSVTLSHIYPRAGGYRAGGNPSTDDLYVVTYGLPGTRYFQPDLWKQVYPDAIWNVEDWCESIGQAIQVKGVSETHLDGALLDAHCGWGLEAELQALVDAFEAEYRSVGRPLPTLLVRPLEDTTDELYTLFLYPYEENTAWDLYRSTNNGYLLDAVASRGSGRDRGLLLESLGGAAPVTVGAFVRAGLQFANEEAIHGLSKAQVFHPRSAFAELMQEDRRKLRARKKALETATGYGSESSSMAAVADRMERLDKLLLKVSVSRLEARMLIQELDVLLSQLEDAQGAQEAGFEPVEFDMLEDMSWCTDAHCEERQDGFLLCSTKSGCRAPHTFGLQWTLNGRGFQSLHVGVFDFWQRSEVLESLDNRLVSIQNLQGFVAHGGSVQFRSDERWLYLGRTSGSLTLGPGLRVLKYQSQSLKSEQGTTHVVRLPGVGVVPAKHHRVHAAFDALATAMEGVGVTVEPYRLWMLPEEILRGFYPSGLSHYSRADRGIVLNGDRISHVLGEERYLDEMRGLFVHEYAHYLFHHRFKAKLSCLNEGLADAMALVYAPESGRHLNPHSGSRLNFSGGCQGLTGNHTKGECILWFLQAETAITEEVLRKLFNPATIPDFDSCELETEETGLGYFKYLSGALGRNTSQLLKAAQVPLPFPYDEAENMSLEEIRGASMPFRVYFGDRNMPRIEPDEVFHQYAVEGASEGVSQIYHVELAYLLQRLEVRSERGLVAVQSDFVDGDVRSVEVTVGAERMASLGPGVHTDRVSFRDPWTGVSIYRDVEIAIGESEELRGHVNLIPFTLPPPFVRCESDDCDRPSARIRACAGDEACPRQTERVLKWTINARPFRPFVPVASRKDADVPWLQETWGPVEAGPRYSVVDAAKVTVDEAFISEWLYPLGPFNPHSMGSGSTTFAYQGIGLSSAWGDSYFVAPDGAFSMETYAEIHRELSRVSLALDSRLDVLPRAFSIWYLPRAWAAALQPKGTADFPDHEVNGRRIVVGYQNPHAEPSTFVSLFEHGFVELLLSLENVAQPGTCLSELIASMVVPLVPIPLAQPNCPALSEPKAKGRCLLSHLSISMDPKSFFHSDVDYSFDSCAFDDPVTGVSYLLILSEAAQRNVAFDLQSAGVALPIAYDEAKALTNDEIRMLLSETKAAQTEAH